MNITEINVITFYVSDLEASKEFYTEKLGFEVTDKMDPGLLLQSNGVSVYLEAGRSPKSDLTHSQCEVSPCFGTESIKESFEELKSLNVTVVSDYVE